MQAVVHLALSGFQRDEYWDYVNPAYLPCLRKHELGFRIFNHGLKRIIFETPSDKAELHFCFQLL